MSTPDLYGGENPLLPDRLGEATGRRTFLKWSGAAAAVFAAGCTDDARRTITEITPAPPPDTLPDPGASLVNLGSGDVGILNYAYALEQLEAAFYIQVVANAAFATTFNADEQQVLIDLRNHEVAHREFLKAALAANAIPALTPVFGSINFASRTSVLQTAMTFEDLGVTAYNGAGPLLTNPDFLAAAGKIASVEARHASAIRDLLEPGEDGRLFAGDDFVNPKLGLSPARSPGEVLALAQPFIQQRFNTRNLPSANIVPAEQWITL
jgi:rubrerythrin